MTSEMKKLLHRHKAQSPSRDEDNEGGDALKASLYEDATSQAPPRVGTRPLKGDLTQGPVGSEASPAANLAAAARPPPGPSAAPMAAAAAVAPSPHAGPPPHGPPARPVRPDGQTSTNQSREVPTNFSRLPPNRADGSSPRSPRARAAADCLPSGPKSPPAGHGSRAV